MTRDHHVAEQAPDWRTAKPGHALREYRRKMIPMADEPRSLVDSWPFLIIAIPVVLFLFWEVAQGAV